MITKIAFWAVVVIAALIGLGWLFHRICTRLEEAGYMYYRKEKGGGGAASGVLFEVDRLIRPSTQHVVEVQDSVKIEKDDIGGE